MSDTHPYISGPGNIAKMIGQLRKSFPTTITSDIIKRLGIASNNESRVINVLQYIGVIDSDGKKTSEASKIFAHHKDEEFAKAFEAPVKKSYSALFELHGDDSWNLDEDVLITFFRQSDQTSAAIGKRQASTFNVLAGLSGHGELPAQRTAKAKNKSADKKKINKGTPKNIVKDKTPKDPNTVDVTEKNIGLTVRIEINLPADGTKETYDNIFKSIRENLINA